VTAAPGTEFDRATAVAPVADGARAGAVAEPRATDAAALAMFADAWRPTPWVRLREPVPAPTLDLTVHFRAPRAAAALAPGEPLVAVFRSTTTADGFFEEDGEVRTRDGVLLAPSRQLALLAFPDRAAA